MAKIKEEKENVGFVVNSQNLHIEELQIQIASNEEKYKKQVKEHIELTNHLIESILKQSELSASQVHQVNYLKDYFKEVDHKKLNQEPSKEQIKVLDKPEC